MQLPREPYLLTPGPLTTSLATKQAMLRDWGSWDDDFNALTAGVCQRLLQVAHAEERCVCVPLQGSGTYAVEATLATLIPRQGKVLVLMNGAYGQRMAKIMHYLERSCVTLNTGDYRPPTPAQVDEILSADPDISHVAVVHCETSSGILNPVEAIAAVTARHGRRLIIDAMSAFGALPLDMRELPCDAVVASANKCFEGVPGFGFALIDRTALEGCAGHSHSLSLDLYDQWAYMARTGQWRFTPPTHVVAAFAQALDQHAAEGGVGGRLARYTANRDLLVAGMRAMGFRTLLADRWLSPIIVTFHSPGDPRFDFHAFYRLIKDRGFIIYPGKLTAVESFRIGCIGQLFAEQMQGVLTAVREALDAMGIADGMPRPEDLDPGDF
ncbi:MAG TPA: 2-aminoethylphosphonate--pyruvate transaminase [Candidatus Competibacteraceae bacterium]|nr:2-aminoethylphosphonate--pyruvate transaminase [Candidatus Competibacteraceae bacterium]HQA24962.1 2-aminoethylphosphonate--pyruvate transaminase [Candidatus Competibacteraceae bacterium]HQD57475.1 2-aminoethylphosphonate--pyruvate transaminase [Candidatus Competibacteraceae bacterium]